VFYIDKLKENLLAGIAEIEAAFALIESPEFAEESKRKYPGMSIMPTQLGHLIGVIKIMGTSKLQHAAWDAEQALPEIAWAERCAAICESLGIDEDNIAHLETLMNEKRYRSDAGNLTEKIRDQAGEVQDDSREFEYEDAHDKLADAGFLLDLEDEDFLVRGSERVHIEIKHAKISHDFWYEFTLEVAGVETLRGKSGEFPALLAAVGINQDSPCR